MNTVDRLLGMIVDRYGLTPKAEFAGALAAQLSTLENAMKIPREQLAAMADMQESVLREMAGTLTIGESFFYRHSEHLPSLMAAIRRFLGTQSASTHYTVWSAGCSDGQEPYSIAIACTEALTAEERKRVRIIASDLNPEAIRRAQSGVFNKWSFRGVSLQLLARYFTPLDADHYTVSDDIRDMVTFSCSSIQEHGALLGNRSVDAVFFRNVAIYLNPVTIAEVYRRLENNLRPGGLLFIAPSDQPPPAGLFQRFPDTSSSVYVSASGAAAPASSNKYSKRPLVRMPYSPTPSPQSAEEKDVIISRAAPVHEQAGGNKADSDFGIYIERGQRHLEKDQVAHAAEDFRKAVFSQPRNPLSRFWYAVSMHRSGKPKRALIQLNMLRDLLGDWPPDKRLSDGVTTAAELFRAIEQLKERLI